jgi:hypothetical protein
MNLAKLLEGPAVITHRGVSFHSRGGAVLTPGAENFPIETDAYGPISQRARENSIALALTPVGVWSDAVLDVLYRWRNAAPGTLLTPRYDIDSIDIATDIVTLLGDAGPRKGCPIKVATFGTIPTGLSAATLYYVGVPDAGTPNEITLHATEAHALAGTNLIDITNAQAASDHAIIEQEPVTIHTFTNRKIVFHNASISGMPAINFSAINTLFGALTIEAYRINDAAWSLANSLYTVTKAILSDTPPDEADIPTQEYTYGWGAAPWDSFKMRGAATLTPQMALSELSSDGRGVCGRKIQSVSAIATGAPDGFSESQLLDILQLQGGTVARGKSRVRADLTIAGTGVFASVKNAGAAELPQTFSATDPRAGALAFVGSRSQGEAAFYVGTVAE